MASEEQVITARSLAVAERQKKIILLEAEPIAETNATATRVTARVGRDAADDRAEAMLASANAEAQSIPILAGAAKDRALAEAEGRSALIPAENAISVALIAYKIATQRLEALPAIIREMVAPANDIDSIKLHQVSGLSFGGAAAGEAGATAGPRGAVDQVCDAITQMAVQLPALKRQSRQARPSQDKRWLAAQSVGCVISRTACPKQRCVKSRTLRLVPTVGPSGEVSCYPRCSFTGSLRPSFRKCAMNGRAASSSRVAA